MKTPVITRFAPSPTGNLHIGGARTALFNFLYARANNGQFLLRIDDTDPIRSSVTYEYDIINSLTWLNISWNNINNEPRQSHRTNLYREAVNKLLADGNAYKCYADEEEDAKLKEIIDINKRKLALRAIPQRDNYTIRFKMPLDGEFSVNDTVMGSMQIKYENLDDFVLLRSDGNPTYMLASVVDDGLMDISNIIRGTEHLPNTYRQIPLLHALQYKLPIYTHIPLIHNTDGRKLSKRYDSTSVYEYKKMGILPEAMTNYMMKLGWGHGDQEIITMEEAQKVFNLEAIRPSPARFDLDKLLSLNSYYLKQLSNDNLISLLDVPESIIPQVRICIENMKEKANTLKYIEDMSAHIFSMPIPRHFDDLPDLSDTERDFMITLCDFNQITFSSPDSIKNTLTNLIEDKKVNKRTIFMYLRISLTGMKVSPGLFEIMQALGKDLCKSRVRDSLGI